VATKTPVSPSLSGVDPVSFTPTATTGDLIANPRGDLLVRVNNGSGGSINVTIAAQQVNRPSDSTFPGQAVADIVTAVPAGATKVFGPIPPAYINSGGYTQITCSAVATVTMEAIRGNPGA